MTIPRDAVESATEAVGLAGLVLAAAGAVVTAMLAAWWAVETYGVLVGPMALGVGLTLVCVALAVEKAVGIYGPGGGST